MTIAAIIANAVTRHWSYCMWIGSNSIYSASSVHQKKKKTKGATTAAIIIISIASTDASNGVQDSDGCHRSDVLQVYTKNYDVVGLICPRLNLAYPDQKAQ